MVVQYLFGAMAIEMVICYTDGGVRRGSIRLLHRQIARARKTKGLQA
jgi:hypothetical protein